MPHSLEVYRAGQCIFSSDGAWLHPLFELEQAIKTNALIAEELTVRDKIVGAASAFLIVFLGIKTLHAGTLSRRGESVLQRFGVTVTCDLLVGQISCATESILDPDMDVNEAVAILRARAARTT